MLDYDILCFTETHLSSEISTAEIFSDTDFNVYRKDRNIHGGGVLIAIKKHIPHSIIDITSDAEVIGIKLHSETPVALFCVYRSPSQTQPENSSLIDFLQSCAEQNNVVLTGDFNLPNINWEADPPQLLPNSYNKSLHQGFLTTFLSIGMAQLVKSPTHILGNILDLILTSDSNLCSNIIIYPPQISDHGKLTFDLTFPCKLDDNKTLSILLYRNVDQEKLDNHLYSLLDELTNDANAGAPVSALWDKFELSIKYAVEICVPTKQITVNRYSPPWITLEIRRKSRALKRLFSKYRKTDDPYLLCKYKNMHRTYRKLLKKAKTSYLRNKIFLPMESGDTKPFYKYINSNKTKKQSVDNIERANGDLTENPEEIANILNNYFEKQFCSDHCLTKKDLDNVSMRDLTIQVTPKGVYDLLTSLSSNKAPGPDQITVPMLKTNPDLVSECLSIIYNQSIKQMSIPDRWREANVVPIHKQGQRTNASNYRPISLTCICCKILEHIVLHHLNKQLDKILTHNQHGFRSGLSCDTQLVSTYHKLARNFDSGSSTHALFLDFRKAFDTVPHKLLINKMKSYNLNPTIVKWVTDFLSKRSQRVIVSGVSSEPIKVTSGVPQGSVIGPKLFLLYINDLPDHLTCSVSLYADDTLLFQPVNSVNDSLSFQNNINLISSWSDKWLLDFNTNKCKIMVFNTTSKLDVPTTYFLKGQKLEVIDNYSYLGVWISSSLNWSIHMENKINKAVSILGMIRRTISHAPKDIKLLAYKSLCRPILEYASQVWDPYKNQDIKAIESVQKQAIRFISNLKGREHSITEHRKKLELDTLADRRKHARKSLLWKIITDFCGDQPGPLSVQFSDILSTNPIFSKTRAQSQNLPNSIVTNTNTFHYSFVPRTIRDLRERDTRP